MLHNPPQKNPGYPDGLLSALQARRDPESDNPAAINQSRSFRRHKTPA